MTQHPRHTRRPVDAPITAAFYLPQFHPIPENDRWWSDGFTEWTNVVRARPAFSGHHQPQVPTGPYRHYDLRDPKVVAWQVRLAEAHDIDAFIYYHYWFDGHRLLETPLDDYLSSPEHGRFAICWANENWTRRWDGKDREILLAQDYRPDTPGTVFESFLPYLLDHRYLRVGDRAVVLVHRADHLPSPRDYAATWRRLAAEAGVGDLWLVASETSSGLDPRVLGFDALAEFPPVGDSTVDVACRRLPADIDPQFRGRLNSYRALRQKYIERPPAEYARHAGVVPRWDNTPRRGMAATCFVGSSPSLYGSWLACARERERVERGSRGLVFINAWNEWAEGAYLEPDAAYGSAYLEATRWTFVSEDQAFKEFNGRRNYHGLAMGLAGTAKAWLGALRYRWCRRGLLKRGSLS